MLIRVLNLFDEIWCTQYNILYKYLFMTLNYLAILVVAFIHFGIGAVYYSVFSQVWAKARGFANNEEFVKRGMQNWGKNTPYILTFFYSFVYSFVLAYFISLLPYRGGMSALRYGFLIWIGVFMTGLVFNYSYSDQKKSLILVDGGYWFISVLVCCFILAKWI
jgi:hypothetical protein